MVVSVTQFAHHGIPASGFVFDSPWEVAYNDFQFNMGQFGADATIECVHYPGYIACRDDPGGTSAVQFKFV